MALGYLRMTSDVQSQYPFISASPFSHLSKHLYFETFITPLKGLITFKMRIRSIFINAIKSTLISLFQHILSCSSDPYSITSALLYIRVQPPHINMAHIRGLLGNPHISHRPEFK